MLVGLLLLGSFAALVYLTKLDNDKHRRDEGE